MHIGVAMSGGVDSSVAAIMLRKMGHKITGITVNFLFRENVIRSHERNSAYCFPQYILDAKRIAKQYKFPHKILDLNGDFSKEIITPFCREYLNGRTPNPCILCNSRIKFKKIIDYAKAKGCQKVATGHYARIKSSNGRYYISMGIDKNKDQSYFLFMLSHDILQNIIFPLGDYYKDGILKIAQNLNLHINNKPKSQDICFISDMEHTKFIEEITGIIPPEGDIVDKYGNVLGIHKGIHKYTIGQRRGLGISADKSLYVVEIDANRNIVKVGYKEDLFKKGFFANGVHYMKKLSLDGIDTYTKIRSTQEPVKAHLKELGNKIYVYFDKPQLSVTPGQAAVFYDISGNILGGAWIEGWL